MGGIVDEKLESMREKFGDEVIDRIQALREFIPADDPFMKWETTTTSVLEGLTKEDLAGLLFTAVFLFKQKENTPNPISGAVANGKFAARKFFEEDES